MDEIKLNRVYQHFKGGKYWVIAVGKDASNLEDVVIYQSVDTYQVWVRPLSEWFEHVERPYYSGRRFFLISADTK